MGLEILILAGPVLAVTVSVQVIQRRQSRSDPLAWTISGAVSIGIATVPCTVAGFSSSRSSADAPAGVRRTACAGQSRVRPARTQDRQATSACS